MLLDPPLSKFFEFLFQKLLFILQSIKGLLTRTEFKVSFSPIFPPMMSMTIRDFSHSQKNKQNPDYFHLLKRGLII